MFEAVVVVCLAGGAVCRDVLVPGYEAATEAACTERLVREPPSADGTPVCAPRGRVLSFEEVAPGVFVHRGAIAEPDPSNGGDVANIGFVIGEDAVAVVDTGGARWLGEATWRAIRQRTDLPVSHVILTHMHPDHVFGASVFVEAGATVVGHTALDRALADRAGNYLESLERLIGPERFLGTTAVATDVALKGVITIDLGGRVLEIASWPVAHTPTDLTVHDPASGLLFAGDLVFDEHAPALDGSVLGWQAVLGDLADLPITRAVPGHGGPLLDWPEGARALQAYLGALEADTRAAIEGGLRIGEAAEIVARREAGKWALFEAYNPRNATVAFTELEWE